MIGTRPGTGGERPLLALALAAIVLQPGMLRAATTRRVALLDLPGEIPGHLELAGVQEPVLTFATSGGQATIGGAETIVPESRQLETPLLLPPGWSPDVLAATALVVVEGRPRWELPT
ncbi:MAG: hypothetical protein ACREQL_00915, partial [Candidatus Binatia bacterium]